MRALIRLTAIPAGFIDIGEQRKLKITACLTPAIERTPPNDPDTIPVTSTLFKDWPAILASLRVRVHFTGAGAPHSEDNIRVVSEANSDLWRAMFGNLQVEVPPATRPAAAAAGRTKSFRVAPLASSLQQLYDETLKPEGQLRTAANFDGPIEPDPVVVRDLFGPIAGPAPGFRALAATASAASTIPAVQDFYSRAPEPEPLQIATAPEPFEFTKAAAACGAYPWLLRKLGLLFDVLASDADAWSPDSMNRVWIEVTSALDARQPVIKTACRINRSRGQFVAVPLDGSKLVDGMLPPAAFHVVQVDFDGVALKSIDFSRKIQRNPADDPGLPPSWRSAGLSVNVDDRATQVGNDADASTHFETLNEVEVGAEHLIRGYHVSVEQNGKWRSLCRRHINYHIPGLPPGELLDYGWTQFSTVTEGRDKHLHESICVWGGWSAVAHRPGKSIPNNTPVLNPIAPLLSPPYSITVAAVGGSLPRLRVGARYRVALQAMNLAGEFMVPITPIAEGTGADRERLSAQASGVVTYKRYEPLEPPRVLPRYDLRKSPGQTALYIVVRSGDSPEPIDTAQRHIVPPPLHDSLVEDHGWLDGSIGHGYSWIKDSQELQPTGPDDDVDISKTPPLKIPPSESRFAWFEQESPKITYLTDKLSVGAAFHGLPQSSGTLIAQFTGSWPLVLPFRLIVEKGNEKPFWDAIKHQLTVHVPQAIIQTIKLSSALSRADLAELGVWDSLKRLGAGVEARAELGHYWALTPCRELTLVHAVQRPLLYPKVGLKLQTTPDAQLALVARGWEQKFIDLQGDVGFHRRSTGQLSVSFDWTTTVDTGGDTGSGIEAGGDVLFSTKLDYEGPDSLPIPCSPAAAGCTPADIKSRFTLPDHRRRTLTARATATSRFAHHFPFTPADLEKTPGLVSRTTEDKDRLSFIVPASQPPAAPVIFSVLPVFTRAPQLRQADHHATQLDASMSGGGVRVYLGGQWFDSGDDEKLAVVLWAGAAAHYASGAGELPNDLVQQVSQWGLDPAVRTGSLPPALDASKFTNRLKPQTYDARRYPLGDFVRAPQPYPSDRLMQLAVFGVDWDRDRQLWFCDIQIDASASYTPFVRLALARFQPIAVNDPQQGPLVQSAHVSPVALASMMYLSPDRRATVVVHKRKEADKTRVIEVTVTGRSYESFNPDTGSLAAGPSTVEAVLEVSHPDSPNAWVQVPSALLRLTPKADEHDRGLFTWSGRIKVTEKIQRHKHRIIVREYEDFPVDGDYPIVPRRYRYAEALEL